jgi:hypothetical protein
MAGGMLTKQADFRTSFYLNDVNDSVAGGAVVSVPAGAPAPASSQTLPGDRIVLDDATASALSDTTLQGTLYGGVYQYVQVSQTTRAPVRGGVVFFKQADIGVQYVAYTDAQPSTTVPTYIAGILIGTPTSGNYAWIQVAGAASVLFDNFSLTSAAAGNWVSAKVSANVASTADVGAVVGVVTIAALLGVAVGLPTSAVVSTVMLTRGLFCGRI